MKKRLIILTTILMFLVNGPVLASYQSPIVLNSPKQDNVVVAETGELDNRAKILHAYLAKYNSPLQNHAQDFIDAADTYNLDWKLVAAISGTESTFGKFTPGGTLEYSLSHNAWGWGVYGTQAIYFKSWRDGIFTVSEGLRKNYFNKGLTNPYSINKVYAASGSWGAHTSYFLQDIEKFEKEYKNLELSANNTSLEVQTAGASAEQKIN